LLEVDPRLAVWEEMNISDDGKWKWSWWLRRCQLEIPVEEREHATIFLRNSRTLV
jgi:hypothetical protein